MRTLVIGCGSIGARHAANAARLGELALFDVTAAAARECAARTGGTPFERIGDAFASRPDIVIVATPHATHLELARGALEAGAHVLVEKPLSHSLEGVQAFLAAARTVRRSACVACNMRFHPGPATLKRSLGLVGQPLFARAHVGNYLPAMRPGRDYRELYAARRREGGGVILDAIHELDYLAWILGNVNSVGCRAERLGDLEIDVEDHALIWLEHSGGARSSVELDYLRRRKSRGCEIVGSLGTLRWQSDGRAPERCTVELLREGNTSPELLFQDKALDPDLPYRAMLDAFMEEIARPGSTGMLAASDAADTLATALAAHESATRGGAALQPRAWRAAA